MKPFLILVFLGSVVACGGSSYDYSQPQAPTGSSSGYGSGARSLATRSEQPIMVQSAPEADYGGDSDDYDFEGDVSGGEFEESASDGYDFENQPAEYAEVAPQPPRASPGTTVPNSGRATSADAVDTSGPLLIYTGEIHLGVFEVEETQNAILERVRELDGFMQHRSDTRLVIRVPARRFEAALEAIEGTGDLIHRNVEASDVGEEFRDLVIRIRNAEAMRDRFEALLARADDVEAALAIERELHRLTDSIETMKGRQRYLADRIAFSTITVHFQARGIEGGNPDQGFTLPFDWLNRLGLSELLTL